MTKHRLLQVITETCIRLLLTLNVTIMHKCGKRL
uniref:Uncharacterized protein n=1 Tax=Anguilla anguilla TaxID=7936 RepID=A0A0E9PD50_ANGAN